MRRVLIAGNWKMNLNLAEARELISGIRSGIESLPDAANLPEVVVFPPFIHLFPVAKATAGTAIGFGAQTIHHERNGAFTGEIPAEMVAETGAEFVLLGHSERRHTIGHLEDDRMIHLKLHAALRAGLQPILCVGGTLVQRDADETLDVLSYQLRAALIGIEPRALERLVVAYEPVWAIGTGRTATADQAQQAHAHLRAELCEINGNLGETVRILYGGSVKPDNARELVSQRDVDGALVGGASLKADSFVGILRASLASAG